ncbi:DNA/RNA nuclease SfsA [Candidatus Thorarchaeota archaeon]|nr:MAG: DNA/RNA nuclease SfsA [Candidatus Thorarchaeota archaeon]
MFLNRIQQCQFLERKNRFLGTVICSGQKNDVFIPNPGRMKELMVKGKEMYIEEKPGPQRKTDYDLIAVKHNDVLISIDSNKPNRFMYRMLSNHELPQFEGYEVVKSEPSYHSGRFDFRLEGERSILIEVKSCTLVQDGRALFPDAPTIRGARHVRHLALLLEEKAIDEATVVFVIQRPDAHVFSPNWQMDPEFGAALDDASDKGVRLLALRTKLADWELQFLDEVPIEIRYQRYI